MDFSRKQKRRKCFPNVRIWKSDFMRKQNKRPVSKRKPYKETAASPAARHLHRAIRGSESGVGAGKAQKLLVRSISFELFCETALKEKIRQYQKWKSELVQSQTVLSLWNNRWVRAEVTGYRGLYALDAPLRAIYLLTTDRPVLCGFVLIWCLLSLSATKMISVPRSTKGKAAIWKINLRRHKKERAIL